MAPLISSYQSSLATPEENRIVEEHLLECDPCREFYGGLQEARLLVGELPHFTRNEQHLDNAFSEVMRRVSGNKQRGKRR